MKKGLSDRNQLILAMLIFGSIGVVRRYIPFPSSVVALARAVIGLAFLLIVRAVRHDPIDRAAVKRNLSSTGSASLRRTTTPPSPRRPCATTWRR